MVKMMGMLMFGVVMAAVAAAGSWYVQTHLMNTAASEKSPAEHATQTLTEQAALPESHASPGAAPAEPIPEQLPVAVRPRDMSVEELLRYGKGLKEREQQVRQQEELLQQRRVQQQLALTDIEGERREVDGLRVQVGDHLKAAEKLIDRLLEVREELKHEQLAADENLNKIKAARIEIDGEHRDNTKQLSQWIQGMEPEKAAGVLKEMANSGKMETAVQILAHFEEREAAKILSAIDDPKLVEQFIEQFRNLKRPVKEAARR